MFDWSRRFGNKYKASLIELAFSERPFRMRQAGGLAA
jgi:hypothetical protein